MVIFCVTTKFGHKKLLKSRTEVIITKMFISVHVTMKGSMAENKAKWVNLLI